MFDRLRGILTRARIAFTGGDNWQYETLLGGASGDVVVTPATATQIASVTACVKLLSRTIANLGVQVYEATESTRQPATKHNIYDLLTLSPDGEISSFEFWETIVADSLLGGKGYGHIVRDSAARPIELHLIPYTAVEEKRAAGQRFYKVDGFNELVHSADMLVVRGLYGKSVISTQSETIGLAISAQKFASAFYAGKGNMLGILSSDNPLKKEQIKAVRESWNDPTGGELSTKVLPMGFKYTRISVDPAGAQALESRKYADEQVCTAFGVPPSLVQIQTGTTYSNTEQQNIHFAQHTILPLAKRIEAEVNLKLLTASERGRYFAKVDIKELYKGDLAARSNYYNQMLQGGTMSINEVRKAEDLPPVTNGDIHTVQVNQVSLESFKDYSTKISTNEAK
jgi:HK97 family phage portal protein